MATVTANKLAEFITASTPARKRSIARALRRKSKGYAPFYAAFKTPAKEFLIRGSKDVTPLDRAIAGLKGRRFSPWNVIDVRVTKQALESLKSLGPKIGALQVDFRRPQRKTTAALRFENLNVVTTPDLLVYGERNSVPLVGGLRFYTAKNGPYQLSQYGAELIAVMEHMWLHHNSPVTRTPDTSLSMVVECFQQRVTVAPADFTHHWAAIEKGARDLVTMWHDLESRDAA